MFVALYCIFNLTIWVPFVQIGIDVIIGVLLKVNDVFFGNIDVH